MGGYSTGIIGSNLWNCDDIQQLRQTILPLLKDQRSLWIEKIQQIMDEKHLSCKQLAQLCQVSEPAVRKWKTGSIPQSRDMFIRIGFAAGYNADQVNSFLMRYGKYPQLYAKSLEDTACIFVLESGIAERSYETYTHILDMVRTQMQESTAPSTQVCTTRNLNNYLVNIKTPEELVMFVQKHAASYKQAYARLYSYIMAFLQVNLQQEHTLNGESSSTSFHAMAEESQWSSSLRHCISEIRNKRWFPLRHKLISLGLHLNMDTEAINRMLGYAQMEPLYAKNPTEAVILWAVEEARLCSDDDAIIPDGSSGLRDFVKNILMQLELDGEAGSVTDDL